MANIAAMCAKPSPDPSHLVAAAGSTSSAVVWTDQGCIDLQIVHGSTHASTVKQTGAETAELAAGGPGRARPGCNTVPHVVCMRAHSSRVYRCSQKIGEEDSAHARGGLSGNPVPRERTERGWTPGVSAWSAMQAYGGANGLLHTQDPCQQESGDQGSWSERTWSWRWLTQTLDIPLKGLRTRGVRSGQFSEGHHATNKFVAREGGRSVRDYSLS